jgi:hypothetical protein
MCRRGNIVQITLSDAAESISFNGLITEWNFAYEHSGMIGYSFTVSPHERSGIDELKQNQALKAVVGNPVTDAEALKQKYVELEGKFEDPVVQRDMQSSYYGDTKSLLDTILEGITELNAVITQRGLDGLASGSLGINPGLALRKAMALSAGVITTAANVTNLKGSLRSDTTLGIQSALSVLSFDTWSRGLAAQARITIFNTRKTQISYAAQVDQTAISVYRPRAGESIYAISNKFYGTPHNARLIRERNKLPSYNLTGEELLIIPEVTAR